MDLREVVPLWDLNVQLILMVAPENRKASPVFQVQDECQDACYSTYAYAL